MKPTRVWLLIAALLMTACAGGEPGYGAGTNPPPGDEATVFVDTTEILYLESFPVQVRLVVRGALPTPCHQIRWQVEDLARMIDVTLWSEPDPEDDCIAVLEPFEISMPLGSFESSNSAVYLNGEEIGRLAIEAGPTPAGPSLIGAGWSFGMCGGYCMVDLSLEGDELVLIGRSRFNEEPLYINRGTATAKALERLGAAIDELNPETLQSVYGCPDCADGGAAYVVLNWQGVTTRHEMDFGRPPDLFADLYGLAMAMINSLEACESDRLVTVGGDCERRQGS